MLNQADSSMLANHLIFQSSNHYAALVAETCRPSVIFKPKVFPDGNMWCALYGDNLQDGVAGFGDSPELAASDFDFEWHAKLSSKVRVIAESKPTDQTQPSGGRLNPVVGQSNLTEEIK